MEQNVEQPPKSPTRRRLEASLARAAARVDATPRTSRKDFEFLYEELPESLQKMAAQEGLQPGEIAVIEFWFRWRPWGWGAGRQWVETAVRTSKTPQTTAYILGLQAIVESSNFGLEEMKLDDIYPNVLEWVLGETGLKDKEQADPKKSNGSAEDAPSTENSKTKQS